MALSPRLQYIVDHIAHDESVIDIAADHGYVAKYIMEQNPNRKIIISDIAEQPLLAGKKNFETAGLAGDFRLGSGLDVLHSNETIDTAIIAGVGGKLMTEIFNENIDKLPLVNRFILSANVGMELVRSWCYKNEYAILKDEVVQDGIYFYETIIIEKAASNVIFDQLTPKEEILLFFFGNNISEKIEHPATINWLEHTKEQIHIKLEQIKKGRSEEAMFLAKKYDVLLDKIEELLLC